MVMPMAPHERPRQQPEPGDPSCSGRDAGADAAARRAEDLRRALRRVQSGAVRGALIGLTLRGGLHLAGHALGALGGGRRARRAVGGAAAVKDTLRYAAFLGALAATYIGVEEGISHTVGKERCAAPLPAPAGARAPARAGRGLAGA